MQLLEQATIEITKTQQKSAIFKYRPPKIIKATTGKCPACKQQIIINAHFNIIFCHYCKQIITV